MIKEKMYKQIQSFKRQGNSKKRNMLTLSIEAIVKTEIATADVEYNS